MYVYVGSGWVDFLAAFVGWVGLSDSVMGWVQRQRAFSATNLTRITTFKIFHLWFVIIRIPKNR